MLSYAGSDLSPWQKRLVLTIETMMGRRRLKRAIDRFDALPAHEIGFFNRVTRAMDLQIEHLSGISPDIPDSGPLLIIANHPFGTVDGLAIGNCIENIRNDLKIIVWDAIDMPAPDQQFMSLDLNGNGVSGLRQNVRVRRQAHNHLTAGGSLLLFPSGSAERIRFPWSEPQEQPWTHMAGKLATSSGASVLPVYVAGHNSKVFHLASYLGNTVRRALFLHESMNMIGRTVRLQFGHVRSPEEIKAAQNEDHLTRFLWDCVFELKSSGHSPVKEMPAVEMERPV